MSRDLTLLVPQIPFHIGCLMVTRLTGGLSVRSIEATSHL